MKDSFVIGIDFGTDSVRSIVVNAANGEMISQAVAIYPRWSEGSFCDATKNQFRQHPLDYLESLEHAVNQSLTEAGPLVRRQVKAISCDTTGSTPVAVDKSGVPLALHSEFAENPNAMFILWKDHTAVKEAAEINEHAERFSVNYLQYVGGIYSSEWFWAKLLHILRIDDQVRRACYSWVEHCDWIPFVLCGGNDVHQMKRGVCAAGHKALWADEFGGLPPDEFFSSLDPLLAGFTKRLFDLTYTSDKPVGHLSPEWAERLGLPLSTVVGVGAFDCHMGAVGGQIEPYYLSKVMGTSTCDMMVVPAQEINGKLVKGICGQVPGSIIPGMIGLEAGQSAFGDTYAWVKNLLSWPVEKILLSSSLIDRETAAALSRAMDDQIIPELSRQAATLPLNEEDELALDWLNGRRTPDADQSLKGAMSHLSLGTDAPRFFKSWVEATCFGAKAIAERFVREGLPLKGLIGLGGVARKSPYVMQVLADVMNMPIRIHRSEQTCALGAAMFAATAAGLFPDVQTAMNAMGQGFDFVYEPNGEAAKIYQRRYQRYSAFAAKMNAGMPAIETVR